MQKRPYVTIALTLLSLAATFLAPAFDSSIYGVDGNSLEWLSFNPSSPFRHTGAGLIGSAFLHINIRHLLTNMIFFIPVGMMMERKESGFFLAKTFSLIHFQVLVALLLVHFLFPLTNRSFLGSSHVIIGLYTYWALTTQKYGLLLGPLLVLSLGLWDEGHLSLLAHVLGFLAGAHLLLLGRLWRKFRS